MLRFSFSLGLVLILSLSATHAQTNDPKNIAVIGIDARDVVNSSEQLARMASLHLMKLNNYIVLREYDMREMLSTKPGFTSNCYSVRCLTDAGQLLKVDQMLSGTVERIGERIIVSLVLVDVSKQAIVASNTKEYINEGSEIEAMLEVSVMRLLGFEPDPLMEKSLTKRSTVSPEQVVDKNNLSGPRIGVTYVGGLAGQRLTSSKIEHGFGMLPFMSQFGYQFEKQYMGSGQMQALIEFIPLVSGMDQGRFVPSLTILNGFRHIRSGLEFAFGPTFRISQVETGYFDASGTWHRVEEYDGPSPNPFDVHENLDSGGDYELVYAFTLGLGRTFRSGSLNIPVNAFFSPGLYGYLTGISCGFNVRRKAD